MNMPVEKTLTLVNDAPARVHPMSRRGETKPGQVLTSKGRMYEVSADVQQMLCYTDSNVLYIVAGKQTNPHVLGFRARLSRQNIVYDTREISYTELHGLYESATYVDLTDREDHAVQQQEILGYMKEAVRLGASDIHIIPGRHPDPSDPDVLVNSGHIRYRIDGELVTYHELPRARAEALISTVYLTMCDLQERIYNPHVNQNARLLAEYSRPAGLYVARVATGPTDDGQHCVLRLHHDNGHEIIPLEDMGYEEEQIIDILTMLRRGNGLYLVSGPVGSGKTTLLANLMKMKLRDAGFQISLQTIEDPIELPIPGAQQKPVPTTSDDDGANEKAWLDAMAHLLRTDSNVNMVGEVRRAAAIHALMTIALTGRPTWSTLHTGSAIQILERLRNAGVDRSMLTDPTLIAGLINQSLVRTLCPHCKVPFDKGVAAIGKDQALRIQAVCDVGQVFFKGPGCPKCRGGIKGRRVCAETLIPNSAFMRAYDKGGVLAARNYWLEHMKGLSKSQHLVRLINRGLVDPLMGEQDASVPLDEDALIYGKPVARRLASQRKARPRILPIFARRPALRSA